jgi:hypothetical protein
MAVIGIALDCEKEIAWHQGARIDRDAIDGGWRVQAHTRVERRYETKAAP